MTQPRAMRFSAKLSADLGRSDGGSAGSLDGAPDGDRGVSWVLARGAAGDIVAECSENMAESSGVRAEMSPEVAERPSRGHELDMRTSALLASAFLLPLVACGGRIEPQGGGTASSSSSSTSPAPTATAEAAEAGEPFPVCPQDAPLNGTPCPAPSLGCVYINYDTGACSSLVCDANAQWQLSTPAGCVK